MKWKYVTRTINGVRKRCKVHKKTKGGELVRLIGHKNRHD